MLETLTKALRAVPDVDRAIFLLVILLLAYHVFHEPWLANSITTLVGGIIGFLVGGLRKDGNTTA